MAITEQIYNSNLSKKGQKNPTGTFEGTPTNVALVRKGLTNPTPSSIIPPAINPVDATFNGLANQTYLEFLRSSPTR